MINASIGQRIKQRRKELGLTQANIREETGISTGNLSEIESANSLPSATAIIQLSKVLQCTTDYILLGKIPDLNATESSDSPKEQHISDLNSIGQRIRGRRKALCVTQTQIQKSCGISTGNLSGIETGRYLPSAVTLVGLSNVLDCSIDWILTGKSNNSKNNSILTENDNQLLAYFHNMSETDQEDLLLIAEMKSKKRKKQKNSSSSETNSIS